MQTATNHKLNMTSTWYVYFLRCSDNSLYTGITTDLERRLFEHNTSNKLGAKYTRVRRPVELVYSEEQSNRTTASKREYALKKLKKAAKESLVIKQFTSKKT
ncbi:GIY-YIG nuclease family protein [Pseudocolwellia sp. HL-MZ19]|uniref:GIY-YIG nuclease family protein n=1 Tax=unclassified Pseudocolwellia TaxID=2848178 RepID=UPI003CEF1DB6